MSNVMLEVKDLHTAYGQSEALHGISFDGMANETIAIMGRNGMGKTTLEEIFNALSHGLGLLLAIVSLPIRVYSAAQKGQAASIVGATRYANLFLNTGHGTLGWTMACGSGKLISDLVTGQRPEVRTDGLAMDRYAQGTSRTARPSPATAAA